MMSVCEQTDNRMYTTAVILKCGANGREGV
jgi:hypothetical protein